jgi:hypothetical protein
MSSSRANRPSPSESATLYRVGDIKAGNDGNIWTITEDSRGVKRWKKVLGGGTAANTITTSNSAAVTPVVAAANTPVPAKAIQKIDATLFKKIGDKKQGNYRFPPITITLQGNTYVLNWELNIPPNRVDIDLNGLPFMDIELDNIKKVVARNMAIAPFAGLPVQQSTIAVESLALQMKDGKNLTEKRYIDIKYEVRKAIRQRYSGGFSNLPQIFAPQVEIILKTDAAGAADTVELPPLVVTWRGQKYNIEAAFSNPTNDLTLDFRGFNIKDDNHYWAIQRAIRLNSAVSMQTIIEPHKREFVVKLKSILTDKTYTEILKTIQRKIDETESLELNTATPAGAAQPTQAAAAAAEPLPANAPPYAKLKKIQPNTKDALPPMNVLPSAIADLHPNGLYIGAEYRYITYQFNTSLNSDDYGEVVTVDLLGIKPEFRAALKNRLFLLDFNNTGSLQTDDTRFYDIEFYFQDRFDKGYYERIEAKIRDWIEENPNAIDPINLTLTPPQPPAVSPPPSAPQATEPMPEGAPKYGVMNNLQPEQLMQVLPPIYIAPDTLSTTEPEARKYGERPMESDIIINIAYKYSRKRVNGDDIDEYRNVFVFDFSPFTEKAREVITRKIYSYGFTSAMTEGITAAPIYSLYLMGENAETTDFTYILEEVTYAINQVLQDEDNYPAFNDGLPNYVSNYIYSAKTAIQVSADTPANDGGGGGSIDNYRRELEQLYIMRGFLSPIAFEKRLEVNQRIFEVQNKVNEANFELMEQQDSNAEIIEDLFEQSFTPIEHEYNDLFSRLGEADADTALFFAPDGTPSELNAELNELIRTPYFIEWFGNWQLAYNYKDIDPDAIPCSKIITEHYEPLIVWHGTGDEFSYFNFNQFPAAYFARNQKYSEWFATQKGGDDGYTLPFFLNMRNPLDLSHFYTREVTSKEFFDYIFLKTGLLPTDLNVNRMFLAPNLPPLQAWVYLRRNPAMLKRLSESHIFDGIHFYETNPSVPQNEEGFMTEAYIIFKPEQCKLAEAKRGKIMAASLKSFLLKRGGKV